MHYRLFETWRLIAAMLVMIYHFLRFGPGDQMVYSDTLYRLLPLLDMFFMISGYLILERYGDRLGSLADYRKFLLRRLARFYPLYLLTTLFFVLVGGAVWMGYVPSTQAERYDMALLPQNLLLIQAWGTTEHLSFNYVAWSLSAEWFCYLLLPVFILFMNRGGAMGLVVLALLAAGLLELLAYSGIMPFESWLIADTWGAGRAFVDFAIGGLVLVMVRRSALQLRSHTVVWLIFFSAITGMMIGVASYLGIAMLAIAVYAAALAERNNPEGAQWLAVLSPVGRVSLGIYLLHPVIETILLSVVWRRFIEPLEIVGFYAFMIVPMIVTILVAMASARYFEKPAGDFIERQFGMRKPVRPVLPAQVTG